MSKRRRPRTTPTPGAPGASNLEPPQAEAPSISDQAALSESETELRDVADHLAAQEDAAQLEVEPTPTPTPAPDNLPSPLFGRQLANSVFLVLAMRWGDHWRLTDAEADMLGEALAPLAARLVGQINGVWGEVIGASAVLFAIVMPRLQIDAQQRDK